MYSLPYRLFRFIFVFGAVFIALSVFAPFAEAQNIKKPEKKQEIEKDTVKMAVDSVNFSSSFSDPIEFACEDSLVYEFSVSDTLMYMFNKGDVKSIGMNIKADYMEFSRKNSTIFATGYPDTANIVQGKPIFKQEGEEEIMMETVTYNYLSKKARVYYGNTKQGEGYLRGEVMKRMPDNSTFIKGAKYTTCDDDHPHFYINMTEGKVIDKPKKWMYFGPSYLVIEDVPLYPFMLPFGLFPQQTGRTSGLRMPTYGEENARGFFLRNMGMYFAIGDNMDLDLLADYYTLGSYSLRSNSRYTKLYKYEGSFNLEYADNKTGDKGSADYNSATTFSVRWTHSMSPKAKPGTRFSANVNFSSANNNRYINNPTHNLSQAINNSISSSLAYGKNWEGSPFDFSVNGSHSQNMRDSTYAVTLPNITFNVNRQYPFARKDRVGKKAPYEEISFTYNATFDNKVSFKSSEVSQPNFSTKINNGLNHRISIGLPSMSLFKHIRISPGVSYGMNWYFKDIERSWDAANNKQIADTAGAFNRFGITNEYNFSIGANTQIYGMFNFGQKGYVKAIRHVVKPNISLSYSPNMKTYGNGWRSVQVDSTGRMEEYNIYAGQPYGYPQQGKSGSINFSLGNNLEMKARSNNDTIKGDKKIALLNTFDISSSYNLLADSMNLSTFTVRGSTNLPGKTALNFGASFDPYAIDQRGRTYKKYLWNEKGGMNLARLTRFDISFGYSFNGGKGEKSKDAAKNANDVNANNAATAARMADGHAGERNVPFVPVNNLLYEEFSVPWNVSINYSYNYSKQYNYANNTLLVKHNHMQTLNFSGSLAPTPNWDIRINSGFDLKDYKLTMTQVNLSRKLHCFNFTFSWVPIGQYKSWSFKIGILSSMLSDILKYDKQDSYWDNR